MSDINAIAASLSAKLDSLDLTEAESNVLRALLAGANVAEPEVQGHGWDEGVAAFTFKGIDRDVPGWYAHTWELMTPPTKPPAG